MKLNMFKEDPDAWLMADKILQESTDPRTKFLGLQVLDQVMYVIYILLSDGSPPWSMRY